MPNTAQVVGYKEMLERREGRQASGGEGRWKMRGGKKREKTGSEVLGSSVKLS